MSEPDLKKLAGHIGNKVREERKDQGVKMVELSESTGVNKSTLFKVEKGLTLASIRTLAKIAHKLKIKIRKLLP